MALLDRSIIGIQKALTPRSELDRVNRIRKWRRFYEGNFFDLGLGVGITTPSAERSFQRNPQGTDIPITYLRVNWFRRIASFIPDFMFGQRPELTLQNSRLNALLDEIDIFDVLYFTNIDALRFGTGVIAADPFEPTTLRLYQPDQWYVVVDKTNRNRIIEDILIYGQGSIDNDGEASQSPNTPNTCLLYTSPSPRDS